MTDTAEELGIKVKLPAVNEQVQANHLLQHYAKCFRERYKTDPIFPPGNFHLTTMRDIQKSLGSRAFTVIEHFFKMDPDGWYSKFAHSIGTLQKNLNQINADLGRKTGGQHPHSGGLKIRTLFSCDMCRKHFYFDTTQSAFSTGIPIICSLCQKENKDDLR